MASISHHPSLVAINPSGTRAPFFCVPALRANLDHYRIFAGYLGDDQPFYACMAQGLDGRLPAHERVEDMAAGHLDALRSVQPHGPYFLGGASSGGTVAWEMAQQLRAGGEQVALLALIDAYHRGHERYLPDPSAERTAVDTLLGKLDFHLGNLVARDRQGQIGYLRAVAERRARTIQRRLGLGSDREEPAELPPAVQRARVAQRRAMEAYVPSSYPGKVTLFYTTGESTRAFKDRRLLWSSLAEGGLELHLLEGDHETVLEGPGVPVLAEKLSSCLRRAEGEHAIAAPRGQAAGRSS